MTPSIPNDCVELAAAIERAASEWFPGDFLTTYVHPIEREKIVELEGAANRVYQPLPHAKAAKKSLLHSVGFGPDIAKLAQLQTLQAKLKSHKRLLSQAWFRLHELLYWGELPSKLLTDNGQLEDIPASLWLGELADKAYAAQGSRKFVERVQVSLGGQELEGYIIFEAAELWRVISAPQVYGAAFQPVDRDHSGNAASMCLPLS